MRIYKDKHVDRQTDNNIKLAEDHSMQNVFEDGNI